MKREHEFVLSGTGPINIVLFNRIDRSIFCDMRRSIKAGVRIYKIKIFGHQVSYQNFYKRISIDHGISIAVPPPPPEKIKIIIETNFHFSSIESRKKDGNIIIDIRSLN